MLRNVISSIVVVKLSSKEEALRQNRSVEAVMLDTILLRLSHLEVMMDTVRWLQQTPELLKGILAHIQRLILFRLLISTSHLTILEAEILAPVIMVEVKEVKKMRHLSFKVICKIKEEAGIKVRCLLMVAEEALMVISSRLPINLLSLVVLPVIIKTLLSVGLAAVGLNRVLFSHQCLEAFLETLIEVDSQITISEVEFNPVKI